MSEHWYVKCNKMKRSHRFPLVRRLLLRITLVVVVFPCLGGWLVCGSDLGGVLWCQCGGRCVPVWQAAGRRHRLLPTRPPRLRGDQLRPANQITSSITDHALLLLRHCYGPRLIGLQASLQDTQTLCAVLGIIFRDFFCTFFSRSYFSRSFFSRSFFSKKIIFSRK